MAEWPFLAQPMPSSKALLSLCFRNVFTGHKLCHIIHMGHKKYNDVNKNNVEGLRPCLGLLLRIDKPQTRSLTILLKKENIQEIG